MAFKILSPDVPKNRVKRRAYFAEYRALRRNARPPWLTEEHHTQILAVYLEARRLSRSTGVVYHVDHIVPLKGETVCGLHVPWNLRAIPAEENLKKGNKLLDESVE